MTLDAALPGRGVDAGEAEPSRCWASATRGEAKIRHGTQQDELDDGPAGIGNAMNQETQVRACPAAITLTPAAEARIAELMSRAPDGAMGVKLSTRGEAAVPVAIAGRLCDRGE